MRLQLLHQRLASIELERNKVLTKECDCMKKFIALVLAWVCVLGLVGCQNNPNAPEETEVVIEYDEAYAPTN